MGSARTNGVTLRQAALIVGFAYLLNPVAYAEFAIYPKLVIHGNVDATFASISSHHGLFLAALFCYLINFTEDIIIFVTFFGELVFMLWLLIRGWKLDETKRAPSSAGDARAT